MEKRFFTNWRLGLIGVFMLSILVYLPSLMGAAVWDDDDLLTGQAFGGTGTLQGAFTSPFLGHYFRPLTSVSFFLDSMFASETPFFYHQTNIVLHAITAVLICWLTLLVTQEWLAGILAGMFFALQPVQVGAVAWIGGRTDVLSGFFLVSCMATLIQYHRSGKWSWLVVSSFAFLLAALTKEQAIALAPAIPISVFVFGSKKWRDALLVSAPFAISLLGFVSLWLLFSPSLRTSPFTFLSSAHLALLTVANYTIAFLFPTRASEMTYTIENLRSIWFVLLGLSSVVGIGLLIRWLWKDHRATAWLLICALLVYVPVSNFPPVPSFVVAPYRMAETGTALACVFGAAGAYAIAKRRYLLGAALTLNLAIGASVTWWSIHRWLTPQTIFSAVAETDPKFMVGIGNFTHVLNIEHRSAEALPYTDHLLSWLFGTKDWVGLIRVRKLGAMTPAMTKRLESNSGIPDSQLLGWFLGCHASTLSNLKREAEAKEVARDALIFAPLDPRLNFGYGQMIIGDKRTRAEALRCWEIAISMSPKYSACAISLAHERIRDGRNADAILLLEPALKRNPWNGQGWMDLADAKAARHDYVGALTALDKAKGGLFVKESDLEARRRRILAASGKG